MIFSIGLTGLTGGLLLMAGSAPVVETPACPPEIKVEQAVLELAPGWGAFNGQERHVFENVSLSEGEPSRRALLVPTVTRKRGKVKTASWTLASAPAGYWLSCQYVGTSMVLFRRLPEGVKSCTVEYDSAYATPVALHFRCR